MKHTPGPWRVTEQDNDKRVYIVAEHKFVGGIYVAEVSLEAVGPDGEENPEQRRVDAKLLAAAEDLLDVAIIEHQLHMLGFTKATAKKLGKEAEDAYLAGGSPGLNDWRRRKREAAIRKAEEGVLGKEPDGGSVPDSNNTESVHSLQSRLDEVCDTLLQVQELNAELLKALKEVISLSDRKHDAWDKAHAAIAKAEGRDA